MKFYLKMLEAYGRWQNSFTSRLLRFASKLLLSYFKSFFIQTQECAIV